MTRAILLVDHGSRRAEANALLSSVAERVRERAPDRLVVCAHLEIAKPDIAQGIEACVAQGATEIVVHPYFLAPGLHSTRDIPDQVRVAARRHPEIRFSISEPLGLHPSLIDAILDRVEQAGEDIGA